MAKKKVQKGTRIADECLEEARVALNLFTGDEMKDFTREVFARAREYDNLGGEAALDQAFNDVGQEEMNILLERAAIKAKNIEKFEALKRKMQKGVDVRNMLIRTTKNKDYNVEASQRTAQNELYDEVFSKLSKEQLSLLQSGKRDEDILAAMDDVKTGDAEINTIAKILKDYPELIRNPRIVESGALPAEFINPDRFLRNFYEPSLVANAGKSLAARALSKEKVNMDEAVAIWREDMKKELDFDKTFGKTDAADLEGKINEKKVNAIIDKTFDNIVNNRSAIFTKSVVANDREAIAKKRRMFYHFKDWRSWGRINKKYGRGTFYNALMADVHSSANQIGMARILGDSPDAAYNDLRHLQQKTRPVGTAREREADMIFKQVRGADKTAWSPTLANISGGLRMWTSMSRLGSLVINSLPDISQVGGIAQRFGYGYWKPYADAIIHAFNLVPEKDRKALASIFKMNMDVHMGYMGRFADATNISDMMSKASNTFFWLNFTNAWDRGLKLSGMVPIARGLARDSVKGWDALSNQTRSQLERFNITPVEWDALRAKTQDRLFTTDNVDNMTDSEVRELWQKGEQEVPLIEYRNHLYRKVYGLFDTICENTVLDPRAYERMVTSYNLPPGTWGGEIVRSVMQFKTYPIANWRRVWYGGMAEMDSTQGKLMYALNMAAGNFMLGYLSVTLGNLAKGLTPPDPSKMSRGQKISFFVGILAPGLGTFLRVVDPKEQNAHMVTNLLFTPSVRIFSDAMASGVSLATGNFEGAKKNALDFAKYANPIGTLPAIEPWLDSLMGKKPYMQPGQRQIF